MPLQAVGSGGTDDHLVIRSYEGKSTEEAEWLVVPSKVAPAFAELHGVFDAIRDPQTLYDLIRDHDGDLPPWDDDGRGFAPRGYDPEWLKRQRDPRKGTIRLPLPTGTLVARRCPARIARDGCGPADHWLLSREGDRGALSPFRTRSCLSGCDSTEAIPLPRSGTDRSP